MGEKSFIPKVLQKESELEALLNSVKAEAERIISSAEHEAQGYIREFEKNMPSIILERYEAGLKEADDEVRQIKDGGRAQAENLKKRAMERLDVAVEEILRAVLPVPPADKEDNYDSRDE